MAKKLIVTSGPLSDETPKETPKELPLPLLTIDYGREDLNALRDSLNGLIEKHNARIS